MRLFLGLLALAAILTLSFLSPALGLLIFFVGVLCSPFAYTALATNSLPANYSDAPNGESCVFGQQSVLIPTAAGGGSAQTFIVEQQTLTFDSKWFTQNNASARPSKEHGVPEVPTADLELQLPVDTVAAPYLFSEFTLKTLNSATYTFKVARTVTLSKIDGSPTKITIGVRWKLN